MKKVIMFIELIRKKYF